MTPERLEQIRKVIGDEPLPDWASKIFDVELLAEVDRLRANVERFKVAIHSLSTRSLAPDRLADDIPDDPDEASTYALGRVGGAGCACGLWAKRDFPEFFATEASE
jgi:hypothetical protein